MTERYLNATKYAVGLMDDPDAMSIEYRGRSTWVITHHNRCLTRDGEWANETLSSNRTEEFIMRSRFTLEEATELALKEYVKVRSTDIAH
jgi:hypothetical protein